MRNFRTFTIIIKKPITKAADSILKYSFLFFFYSEKKYGLTVYVNYPQMQLIQKKCQPYYFFNGALELMDWMPHSVVSD